MTDLTTASFELGISLLNRRPMASSKAAGQFITPPTLAHFAAEQLGKHTLIQSVLLCNHIAEGRANKQADNIG